MDEVSSSMSGFANKVVIISGFHFCILFYDSLELVC